MSPTSYRTAPPRVTGRNTQFNTTLNAKFTNPKSFPERRWIPHAAADARQRAAPQLQAHEVCAGVRGLEVRHERRRETESRIVAGVADDDDGRPAGGAAFFDAAHDQRGSDAAALTIGTNADRRERRDGDRRAIAVNPHAAEQGMSDELIVLDRDDRRNADGVVSKAIDQVCFSGSAKRILHDAAHPREIGQTFGPDFDGHVY